MTGSSIAAGASSCSTVTSLVSSIFYFCSGPETDKNPPPTDDAGSPTPTEGVPVGTYKIPEGTVAYSVVRLTGDIKVLPVDEDATDGTGRRMGINVVSSAGINIVDERNYSFGQEMLVNRLCRMGVVPLRPLQSGSTYIGVQQ